MSNPLKSAVSSLRSTLIDNWPIKLTALGLAAALWAAVAAQEPTTQIVPVLIRVEPPPGRTVESTIPEVRALFRGIPRELMKLYAEAPVIRKTLPDTITGSDYVLTLATSDIAVIDGAAVNPQQVEPQSIRIVLDDVGRKSVPVVHRVTVAPDSGHRIFGGISVSPGSITIQGPQDRVAGVSSVTTLPLALTGVRTPVRRRVPIDTSTLDGLRISPSAVTVTADISALADRVFDGVVVTLDGSERGQWVAEPGTVNVIVTGRITRMSSLTRDSVRVFASPPTDGDEATVPLRVEVPQDLGARVTPDSVTVRGQGSD
jgi:YbbR domain-containing protein